jgi:hypothetical protein
VRFRPAEGVQQMFQYHSSKTGRKTWFQVTLSFGVNNPHEQQVRRVLTILGSHAKVSVLSPFRTRDTEGASLSSLLFACLHLMDNLEYHKSRLHSSHKSVLAELIEEARTHYLQASISRVTLHLTDGVCFFPLHCIQEYLPFFFVSSMRGAKR